MALAYRLSFFSFFVSPRAHKRSQKIRNAPRFTSAINNGAVTTRALGVLW
jgi:hypothetical protein